MKRLRAAFLLLALAATAPLTRGQDAGGIKVDYDAEELLGPYTSFTVLFPEAIIPADQIDAADVPSPITVSPELDAKFLWRTQSMGLWQVAGPRIPSQTYQLRLREGLTDLGGRPLPVAEWKMELEAAPLSVVEDYGEREKLSSRPQVPLEFNYPMNLGDAAGGIWFQDRATRQRFPAEILLNYAEADSGDAVDVTGEPLPTPSEFRVRPRDPLPVGRFYDLVVGSPRDAYAGRTLPYPHVFPLGRTRPLAVDYIVARNWPQQDPHIEVKFDVPLGEGPVPPGAVEITPPVPNLRFRKDGQFIYADGDFDTSVRYKVTVSDAIEGDRGFPLAQPSAWGATFHPKPATIQFPGGVIRQRAALGLRFALLQANTGPITWKLAPVPLGRIEEIRKARAAIEDSAPALLIDRFALAAAASGEIPASSGDREEFRRIEWKPAGARRLSGPFLIEASARDAAGRTVSNSAFVYFNEFVFTQKTSADFVSLRLADMGSGKPVPGVPVRVVTADLTDIATAETGETGVAIFPSGALTGASWFIAETPSGPSVEPAAPGPRFPSGSFYRSAAQSAFRGAIIPDRTLYRPGQEVRFKGFLRERDGGELRIPKGTSLEWEITPEYDEVAIASGTATVNAFGGWDGIWTAPEQGKLGDFQIHCKIENRAAGEPGEFSIEEFRVPAFSVICETQPATAAAESSITVSSQYFHGAPNVGSAVKWTATWISDHDGDYYPSSEFDGFTQADLSSEHHAIPSFEVEVEGEATLDENGRVTLVSQAPFKDPGNRAECTVLWRIDVTGPDGQTISGGINDRAVMNDVTLGVRADEQSAEGTIAFDLRAIPRVEGGPPPAELDAALFLVETKSVKERIAPFVYRYRNTDVFSLVEHKNTPASGRIAFTPKTPGRYVLVASPLPGQPGIPVSAEIYLAGPGEAEIPVKSDQALEVKPAAADKPAVVGESAAFHVLTPSPGIAWVTVETDRVLDSHTMTLDGNSGRIEIPVKPEYAPNAFLAIYLLRPGGPDDLPGEMFGYAEFDAVQPDAALELAVTTERPEYEPRQTIRGEVRVHADGHPVSGAELTIYAVDDAILELGGWELPTLPGSFFPARSFGVTTHLGLSDYIQSFDEKSLTQKGYVVGGGGKDEFGNVRFTRKDFRPLILWEPSVKTSAGGVAKFECEAPDNLTRFRVIALGQTTRNQFGSGDGTFAVSKQLLLETALPRFVRQGDALELRAVARQKAADSLALTVRCEAGGGMELTGPAELKITAGRDAPQVVRFPAKVAAGARTATIRFHVESGAGLSDSIEVTLPVESPTITVHESIAGDWTGPAFSPAKFTPAAWRTSEGGATATLSTSPHLTKLLGIPMILDYPHGCFEQKSSRLLAFTALAKLLAFLPFSAERDASYRAVIEASLREFDAAVLPDRSIPYWPAGTVGSPFVTVQTAWAVAEAIRAGYDVPASLASGLPFALELMIQRKSRVDTPATIRAFALFALSQFDREPSEETTAAAAELFLNRDRLSDEGRAMLAVAFHELGIFPEHQAALVAELPAVFPEHEFKPETFSSTTRTEAIATWARLLIAPDADTAQLDERLEKVMESSDSLSTQENLWLLVAFNQMLAQKPPAKLPRKLDPKPGATAPNGSSAEWSRIDLAKLADFTIKNLGESGTFILAAARALPPAEQAFLDHGMRVERVVRNLTDPARTGAAESPFKLGDQLLISFRMFTAKPQSYVALEDALPAGIEIINPNLAMFGKTYSIPDDPAAPAAALSHCEMRDTQTNLYFDALEAGARSSSILARATTAGTFAWPSTRIAPMYDARSHGRSAPSQCTVTSE